MNNSDNISKVETTTTTTTTSNPGIIAHIKEIANKSIEKVGEGLEITKEKVGEGYEFTKEKVTEGIQVSKEHLATLGHAINEQLPEKIQFHPDHGTHSTKTVEETVHKNVDGSTKIEKETVHTTK